MLLKIISLIILVAIRMGRRASIERREIVIKHYKEGKPQKEIAEIVELSPSTVQLQIRAERNKIFNEADERWILRNIKQDPKRSV